MTKLTHVSTLEGHSERVWSVAWSPDGRLLASCSSDKRVKIWSCNLESKKWSCVTTIDDSATRTIRNCTWSPCGKYLAIVSFDGSTGIWEKVVEGVSLQFELLASLEGHENEVKSVTWSSDGSLVATCGRDKSIWIWEASDEGEFECISVLHGHSQDVKMVLWHPFEKQLFSASYDNTIKIWSEDGYDWFNSSTLNGHQSSVWSLSFENEGKRMISAADDCVLIIWKYFSENTGNGESSSWQRVCTLSGYHQYTIYSVDWLKMPKMRPTIATGAGDNNIRIFTESEGSSVRSDSPSFDLVTTVNQAHDGDVNCVSWGPILHLSDCIFLASSGDDCLVKIWRCDDS